MSIQIRQNKCIFISTETKYTFCVLKNWNALYHTLRTQVLVKQYFTSAHVDREQNTVFKKLFFLSPKSNKFKSYKFYLDRM